MNAIVLNSKVYPAVVSRDYSSIRAVSHPIRIKILEMLSERPMYPIEIAKRLKMIEQKVYYHINILKKAELVEEVDVRQMRGGKARLLRPVALAFGFVMPNAKGGDFVEGGDFEPFVQDGVVNARIVVGSPDPHGRSRARARDGHIAAEVAAFFAKLGSIPWPFIYEDVEVKDLRSNLILVGGPVVNVLSDRFNDYFPVRFDGRAIRSPGKEYTEDWIGFVSVSRNPLFPDSRMMMIAGKTRSGTRAASLALRRYFDEVKNKGYVIVQGFDEDGDGVVDSVELVE